MDSSPSKPTWLGRLTDDVREMVREQADYRDLLWQLTMRDLMLRYKQTVMGFGWAVFMPLVNTVVFSVIFTRVAPLDTGVPYPLFAFCGLLVWNFLASALRFSATSLTSNDNLVTKVYFPREMFPFSAVIVALVDCAVGALLLAALMAYYGISIGWPILLLPLVILTHLVFTAGVGLVLAMANLFFRDVKYLFEVVLTIWMFGTSVVYPVDRVGGALGTVLMLNPMTPIINAYRDVLLFARPPDAAPFAAAALLSWVVFAVGWLVFHRAETAFAENI